MTKVIIVHSCEDCPYSSVLFQKMYTCRRLSKVIKDEEEMKQDCPLLPIESMEEELACATLEKKDDKIDMIKKCWEAQQESIRQQNIRALASRLPDTLL